MVWRGGMKGREVARSVRESWVGGPRVEGVVLWWGEEGRGGLR